MSLESTYEKIAADRERYSCQVARLGECKIPTPIRSQEFYFSDAAGIAP